MTHNTRGIVLRIIKYGETSIIATIYTELFGIQTYLINGIRTSSKNSAGKINMFQPAAILDMIVYHNQLKNIQRVKECRWSYLYQNLYYDVVRNAISLYSIELLHKSLKQPEENSDLFQFVEDALKHLDSGSDAVIANFPLYFSLHLMSFYGMRFSDDYSEQKQILDLAEGAFVAERPHHPHFIEGNLSHTTSQLLRVMQPGELVEIKLNKEIRRTLLQAYITFYSLHIQDFGTMKTLPVLTAILS